MPQASRLTIAKNDIFAYFDKAGRTVYTHAQIAEALAEQRSFWRLAVRTSTLDFISYLVDQKRLKRVVLRSQAYEKEIVRYSWGDASPYAIALSIRKSSYLSHGTAVFLHGLTDLIPKTVYLNVEQSAKPTPTGELTQNGINRAFANKQRQSNLSYSHDDWSITIINGKQTGRLAVETVHNPQGESLEVTNLERTLIDIAVRPAYAGGIFQVLQAYRSARDQVSANRLVSILRKLDYIYPYHQAIGFLMQRARYAPERCALLRDIGIKFDFHLTHGVANPQYDSEWRLFYPPGLEV